MTTTDRSENPVKNYATTVIGVGRLFAGLSTWISPPGAWRMFGLGPMTADGSTGLISRLFGVRDVVLGAAVLHPDPAVRRAVVQVGMVIDTVDVTANLIAVRQGAPKSTLLGVASGAALFVALGAVSLTKR